MSLFHRQKPQTFSETLRFVLFFIVSFCALILIFACLLVVLRHENKKSAVPEASAEHGQLMPRYSVSLDLPTAPLQPKKPIDLKFKVYDADSGAVITQFAQVHEDTVHMAIVNSTLDRFIHGHPELEGDDLIANTVFPAADMYYVYLIFQPQGGLGQEFAFTVNVGAGSKTLGEANFTEKRTAESEGYAINLLSDSAVTAKDLVDGNGKLIFEINDTNGTAVSNLHPFFDALGRLSLVNTKTHELVHVYSDEVIVKGQTKLGPQISFSKKGVWLSPNRIKPGTYRMFLEFLDHDNVLHVPEFTTNLQ